jgi:hypothetical protein
MWWMPPTDTMFFAHASAAAVVEAVFAIDWQMSRSVDAAMSSISAEIVVYAVVGMPKPNELDCTTQR